MAATAIDLRYATLIGTADQIRSVLAPLAAAAVVDARFANFVITDSPLTSQQFREALATTPRPQRGKA
jgi:hypothetical protein